MSMSFYEKFKKYEPSDYQREILDKLTEYTAGADVDKRMIQVNAVFSEYVPFEELAGIEESIKKAYDLNYMAIHPRFSGVSFNLEYMGHIFYELTRTTAQGNGFFEGAVSKLEGAEITANENVLSISLKNGGKNLLIAGKCDKIISEIIYNMFGAKMAVDFCGVTSIEYDEIALTPLPEIHMPLSSEEKEAETEKAAASLLNTLSNGSAYSDIDPENAIVKSGMMVFDISEMENVYNRVKSIAVVPLRNATLNSEAFTAVSYTHLTLPTITAV